jgi:hypothetical protein
MAQAKDRRSGSGNEKRESLRSPPSVDADLVARRTQGDIPTPPRAMTKLFDASCTLAGP